MAIVAVTINEATEVLYTATEKALVKSLFLVGTSTAATITVKAGDSGSEDALTGSMVTTSMVLDMNFGTNVFLKPGQRLIATRDSGTGTATGYAIIEPEGKAYSGGTK